MERAIAKPDPDHEVRMGSEYADARTYLSQTPRNTSLFVGRKKFQAEPQHGSNDSDFGIPDQNP